MPDLERSLHGRDLGHLRIVAESWGVELNAPDARSALEQLRAHLLSAELVREVVETLPPEAQAALQALQHRGGRMLWSQFTRQFGEVREMGPGRRDRLRPHRNPASAAEMLWYRALLARAFFDTERGAEEFAYIPEDLHARLPSPPPLPADVCGRPATPEERQSPRLAGDLILDHACTLLAAQRIGLSDPPLPPAIRAFLRSLLTCAGILTPEGAPAPDTTRQHLEQPRGAALTQLAQTWLHSAQHNDWRLVPHLQMEGEWQNDPVATRGFILQQIKHLPAETWWSLSAFIADIRSRHPDFQRPGGDYDSWFIRQAESGEFLRGFEHWDEVDGALLRYLVSGPLHWLGFVDLAFPQEGASPTQATAFRRARHWDALLAGEEIPARPEDALLHLRSDGRLSAPPRAPRPVRYQIARFCQWEGSTPHEYRYRITARSLERAQSQGLKPSHLLTLLERHASNIPPNLVAALKRWAQQGTAARLQTASLLRVASPEVLKALRSSRAARFLGEPLGPAAVLVKRGAEEKVLASLLELGFLGELVTAE